MPTTACELDAWQYKMFYMYIASIINRFSKFVCSTVIGLVLKAPS